MGEPGAAGGEGGTASSPGGEPDGPAGAGRWVESSWELRHGLTVHEGLPADAALEEWIEAQLRSA